MKTESLRVEELAAQAGTSVDTIRYYQGMGLLPPSTKDGRTARYGAEHLSRLTTIRTLADDGFTLAQIKRLIDVARPWHLTIGHDPAGIVAAVDGL